MGIHETEFQLPNGTATDEQLMTALLGFANGKSVELVHTPGGSLCQQGGARRSLQTEFSQLLAKASKDRAELAEMFVQKVGIPLIRSLKVRPAIEYGDRGFTLSYLRDFPTLRTALHYAVLLLLDLNHEYGSQLCRCGLQRCSQFYLAVRNPRGGPANRRYCSTDHRDEAHNSKQNRAPRKQK